MSINLKKGSIDDILLVSEIIKHYMEENNIEFENLDEDEIQKRYDKAMEDPIL